MDVQLIFRKQLFKDSSSLSGVLNSAPSVDYLSNCWSRLRAVKLRAAKDEVIDPSIISQLRQEWLSAKRCIRQERRKSLKEMLSQRDITKSKARSLHSAVGAINKGLKELNRLNTLQRRKKPYLKKGHFSSLEDLGQEIQRTEPRRQQLLHQREELYVRFHQTFVHLSWLSDGWPIDPYIDQRGNLVDARYLDRQTAQYYSSGAIRRVIADMRQLEAQLDIYAVRLIPQWMSDEEWKHFATKKLSSALDALKCSSSNCGHMAQYADTRDNLFCEHHISQSQECIHLCWLPGMQIQLKKLLSYLILDTKE